MLPAMNNDGVSIYVDPASIRNSSSGPTQPVRWMSTGNRLLPGLANGYVNPHENLTVFIPPQINSAGRAVLTQYINTRYTEQELVVYDVVKGTRLATINTLGTFRRFRDIQINDAGKVSLIAETDSGQGGIYTVNGSTLTPVFVRKGLARNIDQLTLLQDGRYIFRGSTNTYNKPQDIRFRLADGGTPIPLMGDNQSDVVIYHEEGVKGTERRPDATTPSFVRFEVAFRGTMDAGDRNFRVRFKTRSITATSGTDFEPVNQVLTFTPTTKKITVDVRIINDGVWEGGAEAFAADVTPITDPWTSPIVYMPTTSRGVTGIGIILDDSRIGTSGSYETEPTVGSVDYSFQVRPKAYSQVDVSFQYRVIPVLADDDIATKSGSGMFTKGTTAPLSFSVPILNNGSNAGCVTTSVGS